MPGPRCKLGGPQFDTTVDNHTHAYARHATQAVTHAQRRDRDHQPQGTISAAFSCSHTDSPLDTGVKTWRCRTPCLSYCTRKALPIHPHATTMLSSSQHTMSNGNRMPSFRPTAYANAAVVRSNLRMRCCSARISRCEPSDVNRTRECKAVPSQLKMTRIVSPVA